MIHVFLKELDYDMKYLLTIGGNLFSFLIDELRFEDFEDGTTWL